MNQRSIEENRYYWSTVLYILSDYFGETPEQIHRRVKNHHKVISTSFISTIDFEKLMGELRAWANITLGVFIPLPNEHEHVQLEAKPRMMFINNFNLEVNEFRPVSIDS